MATRPQTIGYALIDSPVGLAAWMLDHDTDAYEKISRAFLDKEPSGHLTRDAILDNITLYWLARYWRVGRQVDGQSGRAQALAAGEAPPEVRLPVGFTTFPGEIFRAPRSWVQKAYPNLTYFGEASRGGHFAAWEEPDVFATEVRAAFRSLTVTRARWSAPPADDRTKPLERPCREPDHQHVVRGGEADRCRCPECRLCRSRSERWVRGHPPARLAPRAARRTGARCRSNQPSHQSTRPKPYCLALVPGASTSRWRRRPFGHQRRVSVGCNASSTSSCRYRSALGSSRRSQGRSSGSSSRSNGSVDGWGLGRCRGR